MSLSLRPIANSFRPALAYSRLCAFTIHHRTMSSAAPSDTSGTSTPQHRGNKGNAAKKEVKILMLHGMAIPLVVFS